MLADIAHGHTWGADVCFLVAFFGFIVCAILSLPKVTTPLKLYTWTLGFLMLALVGLGWLIL